MDVDRVHIPLLVQRLRADRPPSAGQDVEGENLGRPLLAATAQHRQRVVDMGRRQFRAGLQQSDQFGEKLGGQGVLARLTGNSDLVAPDVNIGR